MKSLRIVSGALLLGILLVLSLPVSGFVPGEEQAAGVSEATQGDTARMTLVVGSHYAPPQRFQFYGEDNAIYKVEWGDGSRTIVRGKGPTAAVECAHEYSYKGTYKVLLYGVRY